MVEESLRSEHSPLLAGDYNMRKTARGAAV